MQKRVDVEGYGPWSVKDGAEHVQPPTSVLEQMVAERVHLDRVRIGQRPPSGILPGTHRSGKLNSDQIDDLRRRVAEVVNAWSRGGGLLVMRPLLLHASSRAKKPGHRRVIHMEFAGCELAGGLQWRGYVGMSERRD